MSGASVPLLSDPNYTSALDTDYDEVATALLAEDEKHVQDFKDSESGSSDGSHGDSYGDWKEELNEWTWLEDRGSLSRGLPEGIEITGKASRRQRFKKSAIVQE